MKTQGCVCTDEETEMSMNRFRMFAQSVVDGKAQKWPCSFAKFLKTCLIFEKHSPENPAVVGEVGLRIRLNQFDFVLPLFLVLSYLS